MRRVLPLAVLVLLGGPLAADQVVLKDGRTLNTKKAPVVRGRQAVLELADGKLVSIPAAEIDTEKTAALARKVAASTKAAPAPTPARAPTLVDAARAGQNAKKATVVLTDQDVAGGYSEGSAAQAEKGDAQVVVGPVTTKKGPTGYVVEGSVQNTGKAPAFSVAVTVEAFGDDGKSVATAYGQLAKDALEPGEKAAFTAQVDTDRNVTRFTYVPRWQAPARPAEDAAGGPKKPGEAAGEAENAPKPAPTPTPEPPPQSRPDYAAPPANAPVGSPAQPGGTYIPQPSSDQPKPPGGGA